MPQSKLKTFLTFLLVLGGAFLYSPVMSGQKGRPDVSLSLQQRTEILFHNGVRNSLRQNDVYSQVQTLRKTLIQIDRLRKVSAAQTPKDDKAITRRVKQLKRMIARNSASEVL